MKPILVVTTTLNTEWNKEKAIEIIREKVGDILVVFQSGQHNSVKLLHGRTTKLKKHQINKLLNQ